MIAGTNRLAPLLAIQERDLSNWSDLAALEVVSERYSAGAIALHWATAALIVVNLLLGLSMVPLPISPRKLQWYLWHKSIGSTIFVLTCARLAWRWYRPPPPPVPMPQWQRRSAAAAHAMLYVLMLLVPLSGWVYSSATGVQVIYLGLLPLPDFVSKDKALAAVLLTTHLTLNFALFALICVHVAAALKHHFSDRDNVLVRMLPILRPKGILD